MTELGTALLQPVNKAAILILGVYTVLWGIWVVNPFWAAFETAALYSALIGFAPEWFWGALAVLCGLTIIWGATKRSYHSLIVGSSVAWAHWTMIAIFYFFGDWQNTGGITSLTFAVYASFIWLNVKVNYKYRNQTMKEIVH